MEFPGGGKSNKDRDGPGGGKSNKDRSDDDYAKSRKHRSWDDDDYAKSGKADSRFCRACLRQEVRVLEGRRVSSAFRSRSVLRQCDRSCGTTLVREYDGKSGKGWIEETDVEDYYATNVEDYYGTNFEDYYADIA